MILFTGIQHRLHHPVVSLSFLNDIGDIINTPSLHYNYQSLVNVAQSSNVTSAPGTYIHMYSYI